VDGRTAARNLRTIFLITSVFQIFLVIFHYNIGDYQGALVWFVFVMIDLLIASTALLYLRASKEETSA
jgi:hypothetical protein